MNELGWRKQNTSLGEMIVVKDWVLVDTNPDILASMLLVCLEDELTVQKTPDERRAWWNERLRALADERRLRAENAKRDVYAGDKALREAAR